MEGALSVPPDRGTIIGRAIWKPRYVVVGGAQRDYQTQSTLSSRSQSSRSSTLRGQLNAPPDAIYLSIYKSKDDMEPIQQHAIQSISDCQVQMVAHRKQGPVLPTLILNVIPDPATDKLRKRRSSRTAGLTATKEASPTTLWFRAADETHSLQDWARFIQQLIQPNIPENGPLSPLTPASPTFTNPFAQRPREPSDMQHRPSSGNLSSRPGFFTKNSNQSSRERPLTYSESPSLRSRRSDLSSHASHASSMNPSHMGFQNNYTTMHPTDLPSPAATIGDYQGGFIEGWTSAQGRSSALNSPVRGRDSLGSQIPPLIQPSIHSSSPPGPRETILDRAFQLRCIPGSEREVPGEEKLSSLARFDALMREADEHRRRREAEEARAMSATAPPDHAALRSAWDVDEATDSDEEPSFDERDEDSDDAVGEDVEDRFAVDEIPASARRALHFIAGRRGSDEPRQREPLRTRSTRSSTLSHHQEGLVTMSNSGSYHLRPQTGYSNKHTSRAAMTQRTHSQPQLAGITTSATLASSRSQPSSARLGVSAMASPARSIAEDGVPGAEMAAAPLSPGLHRSSTTTAEKRASSSSTKRLSFTEFTKRLSSTSSLLLVQTNTSGTSSRGSNSDVDPQQPHQINTRTGPPPTPRQQSQPQPGQQPSPQLSDWEKRCGWRGSVGVFGSAEGGFL
ncbi:hypothetical protein B0T22DRAFT_499997 [Podospora appendiculata]|uniref:Uncharacterized protein n=1 Tax=Podospora appendiculata TaxID=314037 RepID=A0AAE0X4X6_9PEZI|nr:hypothetical protein B0T22DRAFT_499997 [Podospora appendiculata]